MQKPAQISLNDQQLVCQGEWNLANIAALQKKFARIAIPARKTITLEGTGITKIDFAGAWFIQQITQKLQQKHVAVQLSNFNEAATDLLATLSEQKDKIADYAPHVIPNWLARIGQEALVQLDEFVDYLAFVGKLTSELLRMIVKPAHIRWNSLAGAVLRNGCNALPIIGLLSFMIGVVLAYQMGNQLRNYGANVFIVDLLGLSVLREFGPLLTAIMIAGRTGSAFTAQLGLMKSNQEIDALDTMGITPAEILLLPRIIGLTIALPLLTIWADIFGIMGGMFMAKNMLHVSWIDFLHRFEQQVPLSALMIGLGKAPVFALIISSIGCFQGIQVSGSAESIGANTTRSVVLAIFFIIVADALFSIILSKLHI